MIKYTFWFEEGSISSEVTDEAEDLKIGSQLDRFEDGETRCIHLQGNPEYVINMDRVKLVTREVVSGDAKEQSPEG